ncbi:glycosyltransferase [Planomonospora sp. ID91781]|uniref:glycosyltransferase n=1 Tax=Planomonospora sp. ID91781 TaxID=2738135 RepID=UPI0027DB6A26|nr:glycosyltransferase [Planomonospora sp. ID91781]
MNDRQTLPGAAVFVDRTGRRRRLLKAAALNTGIAHASHDILIMVDGDTMFEPATIGNLVRPLAGPTVGAVSGNTKVGNRGGMIARWQHIEYVGPVPAPVSASVPTPDARAGSRRRRPRPAPGRAVPVSPGSGPDAS